VEQVIEMRRQHISATSGPWLSGGATTAAPHQLWVQIDSSILLQPSQPRHTPAGGNVRWW
jgi:hypothetical protein